MILTVKDVDYLGDYTLLCTFNDGVTKKVDLQPLLKYPAFAELKDKKKFVQFGLDQTIFWYNGRYNFPSLSSPKDQSQPSRW